MYKVLNQMQMSINRAGLTVGNVRLGTITSVNPNNYSIKVNLEPDDTETGFIPYCTSVYGWVAPPVPGNRAVVLFQEGSTSVPIGAFVIYTSDVQPPGIDSPGDVVSGELAFIHSSGSHVYLSNDGKVSINGQVEIDVSTPKLVITTTGDVEVTTGGNLTAQVTGNAEITAVGNAEIVAGGNASITGTSVSLGNGTAPADSLTLFNELKTYIDSHTHSIPGDNTGVPNTALPSSASTTIVTAA